VITVRATGFDAVAAEGGAGAVEQIDATPDSGKSSFVGCDLTKLDRPELTSARTGANRCSGIPRTPVFRPEVVITRTRLTLDDYKRIYAEATKDPADRWIANAIKLALVSGQRREDIGKMQFSQIRDGFLLVEQPQVGRNDRVVPGQPRSGMDCDQAQGQLKFWSSCGPLLDCEFCNSPQNPAQPLWASLHSLPPVAQFCRGTSVRMMSTDNASQPSVSHVTRVIASTNLRFCSTVRPSNSSIWNVGIVCISLTGC
jgi:hypothetical protein